MHICTLENVIVQIQFMSFFNFYKLPMKFCTFSNLLYFRNNVLTRIKKAFDRSYHLNNSFRLIHNQSIYTQRNIIYIKNLLFPGNSSRNNLYKNVRANCTLLGLLCNERTFSYLILHLNKERRISNKIRIVLITTEIYFHIYIRLRRIYCWN